MGNRCDRLYRHRGLAAARGLTPRLMVRRPLRGIMPKNHDILFPLLGQTNPHPGGAVSRWNLRLPVVAGALQSVLGIALEFPTIHDGIPAVLEDAVSFYWLPSNLDRI